MEDASPIFLPLFPLEVVVYPGEDQRLHIFEPRYKQLISECRDEGITFGIPACAEGKMSAFGTEMALVEVFRVYPDGEMDIQVRGTRRFRVDRFLREVPGKLYSAGEVVFLPEVEDASPAVATEVAESYARVHELLKTGAERDDFGRPDLSYRIAHEIGLALPQKIELLTRDRESERQSFILEHLRKVIPLLEGAMEMRKQVGGNGRFKKLPSVDP